MGRCAPGEVTDVYNECTRDACACDSPVLGCSRGAPALSGGPRDKRRRGWSPRACVLAVGCRGARYVGFEAAACVPRNHDGVADVQRGCDGVGSTTGSAGHACTPGQLYTGLAVMGVARAEAPLRGASVVATALMHVSNREWKWVCGFFKRREDLGGMRRDPYSGERCCEDGSGA